MERTLLKKEHHTVQSAAESKVVFKSLELFNELVLSTLGDVVDGFKKDLAALEHAHSTENLLERQALLRELPENIRLKPVDKFRQMVTTFDNLRGFFSGELAKQDQKSRKTVAALVVQIFKPVRPHIQDIGMAVNQHLINNNAHPMVCPPPMPPTMAAVSKDLQKVVKDYEIQQHQWADSMLKAQDRAWLAFPRESLIVVDRQLNFVLESLSKVSDKLIGPLVQMALEHFFADNGGHFAKIDFDDKEKDGPEIRKMIVGVLSEQLLPVVQLCVWIAGANSIDEMMQVDMRAVPQLQQFLEVARAAKLHREQQQQQQQQKHVSKPLLSAATTTTTTTTADDNNNKSKPTLAIVQDSV